MNKKDLINLIALGEGFTAEFKQGGTSNLGREICSFANATGGVILIGVTVSEWKRMDMNRREWEKP